jgi:shikimate kinase
MRSYVLIGMPGSGKTTKGKVIAARLGMLFLDTDEYILQTTGKTPAMIVDEYGRDEFIKIQDDLISKLQIFNNVISTGGGVVYSENAMRNLKKNGTVIFLNAALEKIKERIKTGRKLSSDKSLDDIYNERLPLYKKFADIEIVCDDKEADEIICLILDEINRRNKNDR